MRTRLSKVFRRGIKSLALAVVVGIIVFILVRLLIETATLEWTVGFAFDMGLLAGLMFFIVNPEWSVPAG